MMENPFHMADQFTYPTNLPNWTYTSRMAIFSQYSQVMNVIHLILWMESTLKKPVVCYKCKNDKSNCAVTEYLTFSRAFH